MLNEFCSNPHAWQFILAAYAVDKAAEYWLGKTDKVKAGSVIELIMNVIKSITQRGINE